MNAKFMAAKMPVAPQPGFKLDFLQPRSDKQRQNSSPVLFISQEKTQEFPLTF